MDLKLFFSNVFVLVLFYYLFKLFDKKYIYCKPYIWGYWLGFIFIFIVPLIFANIICFFSPPLWVSISVLYLASVGCIGVWYALIEYNKERLKQESIESNHFMIKNPKFFSVLAFFPMLMFTIAIILIVFLK